jgi:hypothetical protein
MSKQIMNGQWLIKIDIEIRADELGIMSMQIMNKH